MDALFAFKADRRLSYLEFRKLTWDERFKTVFPVQSDSEIKEIYEHLRSLRKRVRDEVLHGLGGRPALLVPYGFLGLVPLSSNNLREHVHYSWQPVTSEEASEIVRLLSQFEAWTEKTDSVWYVVRFMQCGFEIPFELTRVEEVQSWMTSRQEFEIALEKETGRRDYLLEQYS